MSTSSGRTSAISSPTTGRSCRSVDGVVVAYGAVVDAGVAVQLADLFVEPGAPRPGHRPAAARRRCSRAPRAGRPSRPTTRAPCRSTPGPGMTPLWTSFYLDGAVERRSRTSRDWTRRRRIRRARGARAGRGRARSGRSTTRSGRRRPRRIRSCQTTAAARSPRATGGRARRPSPGPRPARPAAGRRPGRAVRSRPLRRAGRGGAVRAVVPGPTRCSRRCSSAGSRSSTATSSWRRRADLVDPLHVLPNPGML